MRGWAAFLVCLLWFCSAGSAAADSRVALVVGNSAYAGTSALANPRDDAALIAQALGDEGFKVTLVQDATRAVMLKALRSFSSEADQADWAVVYYAGHGVEVGGVNYLLPTDVELREDRDVQDEAISLERVLAAVANARKLRLVILDACRTNPFVSAMRRTTLTRAVARGLAAAEPPAGILVVYAAAAGQVAEDGAGGHSPFAAALARRIREPGLEINKLFNFVARDVLDATGQRQRPYLYGSNPTHDDFFFGSPSAAVSGSAGLDEEAQASAARDAEEAARRRAEAERERALAKAAAPDTCDRLAGNPYDRNRKPDSDASSFETLKGSAEAAVTACEVAARDFPSELRFRYQLARAYQAMTPSNSEKAIPLLKALMARRYPAAFDNYGWELLHLAGSPDVWGAVATFRTGATLGDPSSMYSLATMIIGGKTASRDLNEALGWLRRAAQLGQLDAQAQISAVEIEMSEQRQKLLDEEEARRKRQAELEEARRNRDAEAQEARQEARRKRDAELEEARQKRQAELEEARRKKAEDERQSREIMLKLMNSFIQSIPRNQ